MVAIQKNLQPIWNSNQSATKANANDLQKQDLPLVNRNPLNPMQSIDMAKIDAQKLQWDELETKNNLAIDAYLGVQKQAKREALLDMFGIDLTV